MKSTLRILDGFFAIASPIALFFFLMGGLAFPFIWREHPLFLEELASDGIIVEAIVTSNYEGQEITVEFDDPDGKHRFKNLDPIYYTTEVRQTLQPNSSHTIRYVPNITKGPVLEEHLNQVQAYRKDNSGLYFLFGFGWLILIIRPDMLYITYFKDWDALYRRDLSAALNMDQEANG